MPEALPPSRDRYAVLRLKNFRLYLAGRFAASMGGQTVAMAVGWDLWQRTHSALVLSYVGLAQIGPLVFLFLPAGHVADQGDRRRIIVWTELLLAVGSFGLAVVSWWRAPVGWVFVCLVLIAIARSFLWPASSAFLPQIVPRTMYADAITWNSGSFQLSAALGPAAGGFIIAWANGATPVYLLNGAACLLCALTFALMVAEVPAETKRVKLSTEALLTGIFFVFRNRIILATITLDLFAVLLGGAVALLPVYANDILHVGARGQGVLQAALPIGSAAMALFLAHRPPMEHAGRSLLLAVVGFGVATVIFGLSTSFWLSLAMLFICGATDNISVVVRHTLVQTLTPDELRGRVSAVNTLFISSSNQFGEFESGFVMHWLGPVFAVVSGGVGTVLVVIATALVWPEMRRIKRLDAPPA